MDTGIEARFTLIFYHKGRLDSLSRLEMDPLYLTMYFEGRDDLLKYVHVDFFERNNLDQPFREIKVSKILKMVEFLKSFGKPTN